MADKCDPDIYDYTLNIKAQRIFFSNHLDNYDKFLLDKYIDYKIIRLSPDEKNWRNNYFITHVKKRMTRINELR